MTKNDETKRQQKTNKKGKANEAKKNDEKND